MAQHDGRITHITGNVGDDPKVYENSKGKVMKISVGVTMKYGEEKETRWVNCSLWEDKVPDLVAFAKEEISKGTPVAVEGYLDTSRVYEGKQQFDLRVVRIGLVTWAKRSQQPQASAPAAAAAAAPEMSGW